MVVAVKEQTVISVSIKLPKVIGNLWPHCEASSTLLPTTPLQLIFTFHLF